VEINIFDFLTSFLFELNANTPVFYYARGWKTHENLSP